MDILGNPKTTNVLLLLCGILLGCLLVLAVTGYFTPAADGRNQQPGSYPGDPSNKSAETRPQEPMQPMDYDTDLISNATTTPLQFNNSIVVRESHLIREEGPESMLVITTKLENTGNISYPSVYIIFRVYDEEKKPLGNMDSFTGELASHRTMEYNATIWNENVAYYRIADVKIPA
jgi:hypothetical protein